LFERWNQNRWTKGRVLFGDTTSLPDREPIAWRETTKRSLGQFRYLLRLLVVLEFPILLLCLTLVGQMFNNDNYHSLSLAVFIVWGIAVLVVSVHAASLIAVEKSNQTLDVLCTTPLSQFEIVQQKFRSIWRLIGALWIPLATLFVVQTWVRSIGGQRGHHEIGPMLYFASSMFLALIYLPMVAWLSFLIGLKSKSQGRAIIGSLAAIVGWCILPFLICIAPVAFLSMGSSVHEDAALIMIVSPISLIAINEIGNGGPRLFRTVLPLCLNCLLYGSALIAFRVMAFESAAKAFGRGAIGRREEIPFIKGEISNVEADAIL
jgi:hypothetical protein